MSASADTASRISDRDEDASWRFGLLCTIAIGLIYGLVHSALRLAFSDAVPIDDIKSNVYTQTLEFGYVAKQPPLYEWMLWVVQRFTGPVLSSFLILKYALLTATFAFLYLIAKRIFADYRWAMLAAFSPLFLYQIGWNVHEGVTQTMGLICAVAATMWAFMRVAEHGRVGDYLLFGLTAGLGLITKYNFAGFLVVLLGSALLQPALRAPLFNWRALLSLAVAALVISPVVYWLIIEHHDLVALYQRSIAPTAHDNWLQARLDGLVKSVWVPFGFLFPFDVLLLLFPGALREGWKEIKQAVTPGSWTGAEPDWRLFLLHMTLGGFIVLGFGALATGATHYLERYMHPFFLLTPLWLLALVETGGKAPRRLAILSTVLVVSTVALIPLRARDLDNTMAGACRKCRIAIPYEGLADALKARGFHSGTIIAATREDAGNLRRFFPDARIVRLEHPRYEPPPRAIKSGDKLAVVWREGYRLTKDAESEYNAIVQAAGVTPEPVSAALQNGFGAKRQVEWKVIVVDVAGN